MTTLTITETPQEINIETSVDNNYSSNIDFDFDMSTYTVVAVVDKNDATSTSMTVGVTSAAAGQYVISLTKAQITALGEGTHHWYLHYEVTGGASTARRAFAGEFKITRY